MDQCRREVSAARHLAFPVSSGHLQRQGSPQVEADVDAIARRVLALCEMLIATAQYGRTSPNVDEIRASVLTVGSLEQAGVHP